MADNHYRLLLTFDLHKYRFQSVDHVHNRLASWEPPVQWVHQAPLVPRLRKLLAHLQFAALSVIPTASNARKKHPFEKSNRWMSERRLEYKA